MNPLRSNLALTCILLLSLPLGAAGSRQPSTDVDTIVGTWVIESVQGEKLPPLVVPTEFTKDGKVMMVMGFSSESSREKIGTWKLEGNVLSITAGSAGKENTERFEIKRLTLSELIWSYDEGRKSRFAALNRMPGRRCGDQRIPSYPTMRRVAGQIRRRWGERGFHPSLTPPVPATPPCSSTRQANHTLDGKAHVAECLQGRA
jgi:uncharacterized protein (TIGR03066 family)